jgi:hypothetical protein
LDRGIGPSGQKQFNHFLFTPICCCCPDQGCLTQLNNKHRTASKHNESY